MRSVTKGKHEEVKRMLNVNIMYDNGISEVEAKAIADAISGAMDIFPDRQFVNYRNDPWVKPGTSYSSAEWYARQGHVVRQTDYGIQLDAHSIVRVMKREPWQVMNPHIDVMFTSRDLTAYSGNGGYLNFCFGLTVDRFTVLSVARFRDLDYIRKSLAIRELFYHELGHVLGMASDPNRSNTEENLGRHCTNPGCVMRQATTVGRWVANAVEAWSRDMIYCPQCLEDARESKI